MIAVVPADTRRQVCHEELGLLVCQLPLNIADIEVEMARGVYPNVASWSV